MGAAVFENSTACANSKPGFGPGFASRFDPPSDFGRWARSTPVKSDACLMCTKVREQYGPDNSH